MLIDRPLRALPDPGLTTLADGLMFPEGPIVAPDGSIYIGEILAGRITRITPAGDKHVVCEAGGGPNGLAYGPGGLIFICNNGGHRGRTENGRAIFEPTEFRPGAIQVLDPRTGSIRTLYDQCEGRQLSGPNDLVFDAHGGFYFTNFGRARGRAQDLGSICYARADGSGVREVVFPLHTPNGVGLSPDGRTLYCAETETARLWAFEVEGPGEIRKAPTTHCGGKLMIGLGGLQRFDSLAVQADGAVCVGTIGSGCISVISPTGELIRQVGCGDGAPTNLCFGGADLRTAYVTLSESGRLAKLPWPTPGQVLAYSGS